MSQTPSIIVYATRLGDDALILGQRLGEWCGHAPTIEVDLSLANLGLDLIGQATLFLELAAALKGDGHDADWLAFRRDVLDYTNCLLVEQPNGDFAQTVARQFFYSTYQLLLLGELVKSAHPDLAAIAAKGVKEVAYHAEFAGDWVVRLGDGTPESHARMEKGLASMWRFVDELFLMDEIDTSLVQDNVGVDKSSLRPEFDQRVRAVLDAATLKMPAPHRAVTGGRIGHHSEHLGHILSEMQFLPRAYPDANWK
jgi:ring-1,2-phenylacetyl-CoA epoxidase subunit PaaC